MAWKNVQYQNGKMRTSDEGGGGGSSTFADLDDVSFTNIQNGQVPKYNSTTQKWENANESGGGGTVTDVEVDGVSVVNQQGVAEIPAIPDGLHYYSTNGQKIGIWIDGTTEVWEKVITATISSNTQWVDTGIDDTDTIMLAHGSLAMNDGGITALPSSDPSAQAGINTFYSGVVTSGKWSLLYRASASIRGALTVIITYLKNNS